MLARVRFKDPEDPDICLNAEKAHALALAILRGENQDNENFDFIDYMATQDNGSICERHTPPVYAVSYVSCPPPHPPRRPLLLLLRRPARPGAQPSRIS